MKEIQIYEVNGTNLLYVVTDSNKDSTYYSKSNLTVEAVENYVVMYNDGVQFFKELPRDFVNPVESSVVDLVEIIQGYINNVIPENQGEIDVLNEILSEQEETNFLLDLIKEQTELNRGIYTQLIITNQYLSDHLGDKYTSEDVEIKEQL